MKSFNLGMKSKVKGLHEKFQFGGRGVEGGGTFGTPIWNLRLLTYSDKKFLLQVHSLASHLGTVETN